MKLISIKNWEWNFRCFCKRKCAQECNMWKQNLVRTRESFWSSRDLYFLIYFPRYIFHKQTNLNVETFLSKGAGEIFTDKGEAGELLRVVKLSRNCPWIGPRHPRTRNAFWPCGRREKRSHDYYLWKKNLFLYKILGVGTIEIKT